MHVLARQILLTVSYTAQFAYPLTFEEIWRRLVQATTSITFSKLDVEKSLQTLVTSGFLETADGFYFLPGKKNTIQQRKNKEVATQKKLIEFQPVLQCAKWLPWVLGVAITGSAAVGNARAQDDTDVLLVIQHNRLWLVRPLFIFFAYLHGKRRSWQKEEENSWCFNLWLEPTSLAMPKESHSMYTAYEVCQAQWLLSKDRCAQYFFQQNQWVKAYLPHFFEYAIQKSVPVQKISRVGSIPIASQLLDVLNLISYSLQLWYMHSHMTRERVHKNQAFFHPRDTRKLLSQEQQKLLTRL